MKAFLLDTNVWLDYHCAFRPGHQDAFSVIRACCDADVALLVASHSIKDFWYLYWQIGKTCNMQGEGVSPEAASRSAKAAAWAATEQIASIATVVGSDASDAWLALKMQGAHDDYEDNLVVAAALRVKAQLLVTGDSSLIAHCPVAAATPKDALVFLDL